MRLNNWVGYARGLGLRNVSVRQSVAKQLSPARADRRATVTRCYPEGRRRSGRSDFAVKHLLQKPDVAASRADPARTAPHRHSRRGPEAHDFLGQLIALRGLSRLWLPWCSDPERA